MKFSRRGFFRSAATGAVALPVVSQNANAAAEGEYPDGKSTSVGFDFTKQSAALQADRIVDSACQFCNSLCRLKVHVKGGRIVEVQGEPEDPVQAGGLCVRARP